MIHPNTPLLNVIEMSRIVSTPVQKLRLGAYLGLMYKVNYKKISIGFNCDLSLIPEGEVKSKYQIDEWPSNIDSYSISGPFVNFSTFVLF